MILRTRPAAISAASPLRPVPALLATTVRSRAPCSITASHNASGSPAPPNPAHSTTVPSLMPATAAARSRTRLSIIAAVPRSERDLVAALQRQHRPRLVRGGDFERQILEDRADAADLVGIALASLPRPSHSESSSPTRTLPPMIAPIVTSGI